MEPWHGVLVATALPFTVEDGDTRAIDLDRYADHVRWLAESGCDGVAVNGSLGEYQTLTPTERQSVLDIAIEAAPAGFSVMAGVGAYGARESRALAEQAAKAGAHCVMLLPPNAYRGDDDAVAEHFRAVAEVGMPIVAYNNPHDTKIDLTPGVLARLHGEGWIRAVKEFSGDVRRIYEIFELAPDLDVLVGADDVLLELGIGGAVGWIAGYPNALPTSCLELWRSVTEGDHGAAIALYRTLHPLLRWDSKTEFVQAIKLSMDVVGRYGGPCRPPRQPLREEVADAVRAATSRALGAGCR